MIGQRLKELRLERGLRLIDVASEMGVTLRAICNYEAGTREPSIAMIVKFCKFFEVPSDYLLGLIDNY